MVCIGFKYTHNLAKVKIVDVRGGIERKREKEKERERERERERE